LSSKKFPKSTAGKKKGGGEGEKKRKACHFSFPPFLFRSTRRQKTERKKKGKRLFHSPTPLPLLAKILQRFAHHCYSGEEKRIKETLLNFYPASPEEGGREKGRRALVISYTLPNANWNVRILSETGEKGKEEGSHYYLSLAGRGKEGKETVVTHTVISWPEAWNRPRERREGKDSHLPDPFLASKPEKGEKKA